MCRCSPDRGSARSRSSCSTGCRSCGGQISEFPGLRNRLVVLSRGGAGPWYQGLAWRYIDLFEHFGLDGFRARFPKFLKQTSKNNDSRGYLRRKYPEKEKELVDLVRREVGAERINILHPSEMYDNFKHLRHATRRLGHDLLPKAAACHDGGP